MDKRSGVEGLALSRTETTLAAAAAVGCLFGIIVDGTWRWIALPCLVLLAFLALRRTVRADRAFVQSQEDYLSLIDIPAQATWVCDEDGKFLYAGERWTEWTGTAVADWHRAIHPADLQKINEAWRATVKQGAPYDLEIRVRLQTGEYRWMRTRAFPQRRDGGKVVRWIGQTEDVHDSRQAEERLRQTAELLDMIGRSVDSLIYAKDRDGRMLYANQALVRLSGVPLHDLLGKTDAEWTGNAAEAEAFGKVDEVVLASGVSQDIVEVFTAAGADTRHYRSIKSPLRSATGEVIGVVGVSTDITDQREAEEREKLLARELDHRAKNLLAVVQSVVSLTKADTLADFKKAVEGRIQSLGRAHSMLAASRWEGADLERVLSEELAPYRGGDQGQVILSGPPMLLKPAAAQSLALVFHELATNAVKYGALSVTTGEVEVRWAVEEHAARGPLLWLRWEERGGPAVAPRTSSSRSGFGSRVIRSSIERQLGGTLTLDWAETGLVATMEVALDRSLHDPNAGVRGDGHEG